MRHDIVAEGIDKLISIDITARGAINDLYPAARAQGDGPLTGLAADALHERLKTGDRVLLLTGWPSRSWLLEGLTENDGPAGAAYLARALEEAYGVVPIIVTDYRLTMFSEVALRGAGLIVTNLEKALQSKPGPPAAACAAVIPFTTEAELAREEAQRLLERLQPAAVISIEMPGRNKEGRYHNVSGREVPTHLVAKLDYLLETAGEAGVLTIGIGDGGNEIGMGNIEDTVKEVVPHGERVACCVKADYLIAACISNWGAYGLGAACLAKTGKPGLIDEIDIERIVRLCADAGAIDGLTATVSTLVDGTPVSMNKDVIDMMGFLARSVAEGWNKG